MFQNKIIVITGGAKGIGKTIAEEFTKNGAACCRRKRKTEQPAAAGNAWKSGKGPVQTVKDFPQEK